MKDFIEINGRRIGKTFPAYIVAEMSANHCQDYDQAVKIIKAAKETGADAVKLQTYTPDTLTIQSEREFFRIKGGTAWDGRTLYDLYQEAYMPWDWQPKLKALADDLEIDLFSTAYDSTAVDFLDRLGMPVHKIASFEVVDIALIEKMAYSGKPLILSTGMSSLEEIEEAVATARNAGSEEVVLLKCTSAYPASPDEMNLRTIPHLADTFHLPVGLSDHTLGTAVSVAAVSLGACFVEKHFTLSRSIIGPDSHFSLEPHEFKQMVTAIRTTEKALGKVYYGRGTQEAKSSVFRRSLFVVKDLKKGEILTEANVRSIRPGYGLHPRYLNDLLGRQVTKDVRRGTPLAWSFISDS